MIEYDFLTEINIYFFVCWFLSTSITAKYSRSADLNFGYYINPFLKSYIILLMFVYLISTYNNNFTFQEMLQIWYVYVPFELIVIVPLWFYNHKEHSFLNEEYTENSISKKLSSNHKSSKILNFIKELKVNFVNKQLNFKSIKELQERFPNLSFSGQPSEPNDINFDIVYPYKKINQYHDVDHMLRECYDNVVVGGCLIIDYESEQLRSERVKYNKFDFLIHRVIPKLPITGWIYYKLNYNLFWSISRAEVWGRLHYNGFEVIGEKESKDKVTVFSLKVNEPVSRKVKPSYFPIIKLARVGYYGKLIQIHKVRTMYPYSEFIQKKAFQINEMSKSGKVKSDFRRNWWGTILRKYWLDELPQLIDWLRGNIKIVGIRAMSHHYFSLYPDRYKEKYFRVKPGFIGPIFDEKNGSFEQIVNTEEEYLDQYLKSPFFTDLRYFFKTLNEIFFRGVKSN